jgi:hypothetical protein
LAIRCPLDIGGMRQVTSSLPVHHLDVCPPPRLCSPLPPPPARRVAITRVAHSCRTLVSLRLSSSTLVVTWSFVTWRLSVNNIAPSSVFALHRCTLFCVCIVIIAPASVSTLHRLLCLSAPCGLSRSLPRYASRANVPGLYVDSSWYGDSGQRFFGSL